MGTGATPEFVFDQGSYYPAAANYYGYYYTGMGSPGESDMADHYNSFGPTGENLYSSGVQTESPPYVYFTPSYGYAQSPYNPYIHGAVVGVDGQFLGAEPYFTNPTYTQAVAPTGYLPAIVQPSPNDVPNGYLDPSFSNVGAPMASHRPNYAAVKYAPVAAANAAFTSQMIAIGNPISGPPESSSQQVQSSLSKVSLADSAQIKQSSAHGALPDGSSVPHVTQVTDQLADGRVSSFYNPARVSMPSNSGFANIASNSPGWASVDKFKQRILSNDTSMNRKGRQNIFGDQNRGPRMERAKVDKAFSAQDYTTQRNIIIYADQYNKDDFPVDYLTAKFFVIKSYTEDDVHKSIKYNVWSSTLYGNKKLDSAYEDAQRMSLGKARECPVFLFFSVNTSGQFCGVAEMVGRVDFHKSMDFWQQDKWIGSFPVKWHIVKDVPNASLRHIILENNEFIPVTSSRDTQEITYMRGMEMLRIFKQSPLSSSLLDDFRYYENREKIMQERKFGEKSQGPCILLPAFVSSDGRDMINQQAMLNGSVGQPIRSDGEQPSVVRAEEIPKVDKRNPDNNGDNPPRGGGDHLNAAGADKYMGQHLGADLTQDKGGIIEPSLSVADGRKQSNTVNQPSEADGEVATGTQKRLLKGKGSELNYSVDQPSQMSGKQHPAYIDVSSQSGEKQQPKRTVDQLRRAEEEQEASSSAAAAHQAALTAKQINNTSSVVCTSKTTSTRPAGTCIMLSEEDAVTVIPPMPPVAAATSTDNTPPDSSKLDTSKCDHPGNPTQVVDDDDVTTTTTKKVAALPSNTCELLVGEEGCAPTDGVIIVGLIPVKLKNQIDSLHGKSNDPN